MEYFEGSYLFDKSSNNNHVRMQTQHADPGRTEMETELKYAISVLYWIEFYSHHSRRFTGLEYALVHAQPPLFVIQRRDRLSPTEG
jgi:mediator of RNA polymerase II transcription subunit 6